MAVVRDLLLTGRSFNATKAQQVGLVSQVVAEGEALRAARATAAQLGSLIGGQRWLRRNSSSRFPRRIAARDRYFLRTFAHPAVEAGLRKFVESTDALPYLP